MPLARCEIRLIFKQIKAGLNSEFSFSSTSFPNKVKEPRLPYSWV